MQIECECKTKMFPINFHFNLLEGNAIKAILHVLSVFYFDLEITISINLNKNVCTTKEFRSNVGAFMNKIFYKVCLLF
jgi:hypothetical protein